MNNKKGLSEERTKETYTYYLTVAVEISGTRNEKEGLENVAHSRHVE